jgi:hypothetical protein
VEEQEVRVEDLFNHALTIAKVLGDGALFRRASYDQSAARVQPD